MIDIKRAKETFKEYIQNYDTEDGMIQLKIAHMYRVTEISKKMAEELQLEKEDIKLAELIGLLHDIGRFEQVKNYGTFNDSMSINHAEQGEKVLFAERWIRKFIQDPKYDELIRKAILNHNKAEIEEGLSERELLHAKIIRDADKTDIFYVTLTDKPENAYGCTKRQMQTSEITDEIMEEYRKERKIDYKKMRYSADRIIARLAFVFDFNFDYGLQMVYKNNYLKRIATQTELKNEKTKQRVELAYEIAQQYIEKRLGVSNG